MHFHTGATTDRRIVPGLFHLNERGKKKSVLVGGDRTFTGTAGEINEAHAAAHGREALGEEYTLPAAFS